MCTEDLVQATKKIYGIDDLMYMFLMHSHIQSDPGKTKDSKEELIGLGK